MATQKSELELMVAEIKKSTSQVAINKVDEIKVMRCMLNDQDYTVSVYDKNLGYIGERSPHEEAVTFAKNIISGATGLDSRDSRQLAENYEFTKRDACFLLDNMRDFVQTYMGTGRKLNIMQTAATEACLYTKPIEAGVKSVPDKENPGQIKQITTSPYIKLVSNTKCPKYNEKEDK